MIIKRVSNLIELEGIKKLQTANQKSVLSEEERSREGFVTAVYSLDLLRQMHHSCPSVICVDDHQNVIGYALVTTKEIRKEHLLLENLFTTIDSQVYKGQPLQNSHYVVVGQLCVAKNFRGKGIAQKMYSFFKEELSENYEYCVTDVDETNLKSFKTHLKVGFEVLHKFHYDDSQWNLVLWDWSNP